MAKNLEDFAQHLSENGRTEPYVNDMERFVSWGERTYQQTFTPSVLNQPEADFTMRGGQVLLCDSQGNIPLPHNLWEVIVRCVKNLHGFISLPGGAGKLTA